MAANSFQEYPPDLRAQIERDGDTTLVRLSGELDLAAEERFTEAMDGSGPHGSPVILDLRDLDFIDSMGLRLVLDAKRRRDEAGGSLGVYLAEGKVKRVFDLVGLNGDLVVEAPRAENG